MSWVFMSPEFTETTKTHFSQICCEADLVEAITAKREAHMAANNTKEGTALTKVTPREECWMDLGGIKPIKTTRFSCNVDGLSLKCEARDVSSYIHILKNMGPSKEKFNGRDYYLLGSFHVSILLSSMQCQTLLEQLEKFEVEAAKVAEDEEMPYLKASLAHVVHTPDQKTIEA